MKTKIILLLCYFASHSLLAQDRYYNQENKTEIKKLKHLIGTWEGEGWIMNKETRQKEVFTQKEDIYFSLDSSIIEIRGLGKSDNQIVHDAVAIIANNQEGDFSMTSFLGDGRTGEFEMKSEGDKLIWTIPTEQGTIRYTILVKDKQWTEKGDFGMNGNWYPFFEMKLNKIN